MHPSSRPVQRGILEWLSARERLLSRAGWGWLFVALLLLLAAGVGRRLASEHGNHLQRVATSAGIEQAAGKGAFVVDMPRSSAIQVPRAAAVERLPVPEPDFGAALPVAICRHAAVTKPGCDGLEALRRIHTRRKVPRMNTDDPPWS